MLDCYINIHKDNSTLFVCRQVVCPDCGSIGRNSGPCWCHVCQGKGSQVMMLPSCNGRIEFKWNECQKHLEMRKEL